MYECHTIKTSSGGSWSLRVNCCKLAAAFPNSEFIEVPGARTFVALDAKSGRYYFAHVYDGDPTRGEPVRAERLRDRRRQAAPTMASCE